jgi:hypothetical protein
MGRIKRFRVTAGDVNTYADVAKNVAGAATGIGAAAGVGVQTLGVTSGSLMKDIGNAVVLSDQFNAMKESKSIRSADRMVRSKNVEIQMRRADLENLKLDKEIERIKSGEQVDTRESLNLSIPKSEKNSVLDKLELTYHTAMQLGEVSNFIKTSEKNDTNDKHSNKENVSEFKLLPQSKSSNYDIPEYKTNPVVNTIENPLKDSNVSDTNPSLLLEPEPLIVKQSPLSKDITAKAQGVLMGDFSKLKPRQLNQPLHINPSSEVQQPPLISGIPVPAALPQSSDKSLPQPSGLQSGFGKSNSVYKTMCNKYKIFETEFKQFKKAMKGTLNKGPLNKGSSSKDFKNNKLVLSIEEELKEIRKLKQMIHKRVTKSRK